MLERNRKQESKRKQELLDRLFQNKHAVLCTLVLNMLLKIVVHFQ